MPVPTFLMLTVAPGTGPPRSSVTRPDNEAPTAWACATHASPPLVTKSASMIAPILSPKPFRLPAKLISSSRFARRRFRTRKHPISWQAPLAQILDDLFGPCFVRLCGHPQHDRHCAAPCQGLQVLLRHIESIYLSHTA